MLSIKSYLTIYLLLFSSISSWACDLDGKTGIVPKNNLYIKIDTSNKSLKKVGLSLHEFHQSIDKVTNVYKSIVADMGAELVVKKDWEDGTVNAFAHQEDNKWFVTFLGGFARHKSITADAFTLVVCHELGHHMGGAPVKRSFLRFKQWATNEGQADYWGTLKCARRVWSREDNIRVIRAMTVPDLVKNKCNNSFPNEEQSALCMRSAMAGKAISSLFNDVREKQTKLSFYTPSTKKVRFTSKKHPEPQCRLDTYFRAALCDVTVDQEVSYKNANEGVCSRAYDSEMGSRPRCWYRPKKK